MTNINEIPPPPIGINTFKIKVKNPLNIIITVLAISFIILFGLKPRSKTPRGFGLLTNNQSSKQKNHIDNYSFCYSCYD